MDHASITFFESLPVPAGVIVSRVCISLGLGALLVSAYVVQARDRIERANQRLRHLEASHHSIGYDPFERGGPRRAQASSRH